MTVIGSRCKGALLYLLLYVATAVDRWRRFSSESADHKVSGCDVRNWLLPADQPEDHPADIPRTGYRAPAPALRGVSAWALPEPQERRHGH